MNVKTFHRLSTTSRRSLSAMIRRRLSSSFDICGCCVFWLVAMALRANAADCGRAGRVVCCSCCWVSCSKSWARSFFCFSTMASRCRLRKSFLSRIAAAVFSSTNDVWSVNWRSFSRSTSCETAPMDCGVEFLFEISSSSSSFLLFF